MAKRPRRSLRWFTAAAAALLTLMFTAPASWAETPNEDPGASTLTTRLAEVAQAGERDPDAIAEELALPTEGGGSLEIADDGRVLVNVMFSGPPNAATLEAVERIASVEEQYSFVPAATVRIDPALLPELQAVPGVASALPVLQPFTSRELAGGHTGGLASGLEGGRTGGLQSGLAAELANMDAGAGQSVPAMPHATAPSTPSCRSLPADADAPLGTDLARELFGVDGSGVTIGIISDSFAKHETPTSWEDDVASGALPGPGNPCGYTTPVTVLHDENDGGGDEGRAMAQLIHGIAPGATLIFSDAGTGDFGMMTRIFALAQAGADIIVDDITWPTEAHYQKSYISLAIDEVRSQGISYFTSAGNSTAVGTSGESKGVPISSWQTRKLRPMECPEWVTVEAEIDGDMHSVDDGYDCVDFDPSESAQAYDVLTVKSAGEPRVMASVGEPMGGVTTQYEVHFYEEKADEDPQKLAALLPFGGGLPGLFGSFEVSADTKVRMVIVRTAHDPGAPLPEFFVQFIRDGGLFSERTFLGDGEHDFVGSTLFGHHGAGTGLAVASLKWDSPKTLRDYSSLGPSRLLFEPVSIPFDKPSPALDEAVVIHGPQIASVDGVRTTFFGDEDDDYRFFGTSAAAPLAAAAYALSKEYAPRLAPDGRDDADLREALMLTTALTNPHGPHGINDNPYLDAGFSHEDVFGAGLIDVAGMMRLMPIKGLDDDGAHSATSDSITVNWSAHIGAPESLELELYDVGPAASADADMSASASGGAAARVDADASASAGAGLGAGVTAAHLTSAVARVMEGFAASAGMGDRAFFAGAGSGVSAGVGPGVSAGVGPGPGNGSLPLRAGHAPFASAPPGDLVRTVTVPGTATSHTFTGLTPSRSYTLVVTAVYAGGVANSTTLAGVLETNAAPGPGPGPGPAPGPAPAPDPGSSSPVSDRLTSTGSEDRTWILWAGGALVLAGAIAILVVSARKKSRVRPDDAENRTESDT